MAARHIAARAAVNGALALSGAVASLACHAASGVGTGACPDSFNTFLDRFAVNARFQERQTRYPLTYLRRSGNGIGMKEMSVEFRRRAHYPGAQFPSMRVQDGMPLERHVSATASGIYEVRFTESDATRTPWREFVFHKTPSCWRLVKAVNHTVLGRPLAPVN